MSSYIIRLKDTPSGDSVSISFESEGLELSDESSKAFQLSAYVLDAIQSLEDQVDATQH
jgi:hypothetical protein